MRTLTISLGMSADKDSFIESRKKYDFILPNKAHPTFTNRKLAEKFVNDSQRMYTQILFELNEIYTGLYSDFRFHLFSLSLDKEMQFENKFKEISGYLYNAWYRSNLGSNGIVYLYNNVNSAIHMILKIIDMLDKMYRRIKLHTRIIHLSNLKMQIEAIELRIKKWGWQHHQPIYLFKDMGISRYEHDFFKSYPLY